MPAVKITCPGCKTSFTLKTQNMDSVMNQTFKCPKCQFSIPFRQLLASNKPAIAPAIPSSPLHTHIAGAPGNSGDMPGGKTKVATASAAVNIMIQQPTRSIPLAPGEYVLGRDSADSQASVKIAPDPYMSRRQAQLSVRTTTAGTACILTPLSPTNPIFVNDRPINAQGTMLHNGDRIVLGMTSLTIKM